MKTLVRRHIPSPAQWVALLTVALVAVAAGVAWNEQNSEWSNYQRAFVQLAQSRASGPEQAEWYQSQPVEIRQLSLPSLQRVDRCPTCHLAVVDPLFANAPEPFRTHSAILKTHPPERFGCTVCHRGEGRAVTTLAAHGIVPGSTARLLRGEYVQAACVECHDRATLALPDSGLIAAGEQAVNELHCLRCHQIGDAGESEGPDLRGIGSRRQANELYAHLLNPPAAVPGSTMPIFPVTRDQAQAITAFLLAQPEPSQRISDVRYLVQAADAAAEGSGVAARPEAATPLAESAAAPAPVLFFRYNGAELFWGEGCGVCHRIGTEGGSVGPALTHIGRVRDRDWLIRYLNDPASIRPAGRMPQLYLNPREVSALVDFLMTLR